MKRAGALLAVFGITGLAGCSALPSAGPTATEIVQNETPASTPTLSLATWLSILTAFVSVLSRRPKSSLFSMFKSGKKPPDVRLGVGDSISVTIWEAGAGGLFSTASLDKTSPGSRTATLPVRNRPGRYHSRFPMRAV
ncbi:MAG: hypothetical protein KIT82_09050 [Bradyrhizobium sp.]|nr:hypothetical protein [Bradyrhizobium sp.]